MNLRAERQEHVENGMSITVPDHHQPTLSQAMVFMDKVRSHKGTILIHCLHGHGRTSTFSVLAKVALGMTVDEAIQDERDRFHYSFKYPAQEQWLRDNASQLERYRPLPAGWKPENRAVSEW